MNVEDYFNIVVYLQPFFWGIVYPLKKQIDVWYVYALGFFSIYLIMAYGGIGHYTPEIMVMYVLMVMFTVYYYDYHSLSGVKPICLAFLIVFLNSYFWELPIHIMAILTGGSIPLFIVQSLHLTPLLFLTRFSELKIRGRHDIIQLTTNVWIPVCAIIAVRFYLGLDEPYTSISNHLFRVWALLNLIKIFRPKPLTELFASEHHQTDYRESEPRSVEPDAVADIRPDGIKNPLVEEGGKLEAHADGSSTQHDEES